MVATASEGSLQAALGILERLVKENLPRETSRVPIQRRSRDQDRKGKAKERGEQQDGDEAVAAAQARVEERTTAACQLREGAMESVEGAKCIIKAGGVWTLLSALSYVKSREEKGAIAAALANTLTYEGSEKDDDVWPKEQEALSAKNSVVERATRVLLEEIKERAGGENDQEKKMYNNYRENAVAAIAALCYYVRAVPAVKRAGAIPVLVECVRGRERASTGQNASSEGFCRKAALVALGNIAAEDTQAENWLDKPVIEMLKQVFEECKSEKKAADFEKEALQLVNCIANHKRLHHLFRKMMGMDALLALLEARDESDESTVLILVALTGFACDEIVRRKLLECNGVLRLAAKMLRSEKASTQEVAIALFANLSTTDTFGSVIVKVIDAEVYTVVRSVSENRELSSFGRAAASIMLRNLPTSTEKSSLGERASVAQPGLNIENLDRENADRLKTAEDAIRSINLVLDSPRTIDSTLKQSHKDAEGEDSLNENNPSSKENDNTAGEKASDYDGRLLRRNREQLLLNTVDHADRKKQGESPTEKPALKPTVKETDVNPTHNRDTKVAKSRDTNSDVGEEDELNKFRDKMQAPKIQNKTSEENADARFAECDKDENAASRSAMYPRNSRQTDNGQKKHKNDSQDQQLKRKIVQLIMDKPTRVDNKSVFTSTGEKSRESLLKTGGLSSQNYPTRSNDELHSPDSSPASARGTRENRSLSQYDKVVGSGGDASQIGFYRHDQRNDDKLREKSRRRQMEKGLEDAIRRTTARSPIVQTEKIASGEVNSKGNCADSGEAHADSDCSDNSSSSSKITRVNSIEQEAAQSLSMMNANGNRRTSKEPSRDPDFNASDSPTSSQKIVGGKNEAGKIFLYSAPSHTKGQELYVVKYHKQVDGKPGRKRKAAPTHEAYNEGQNTRALPKKTVPRKTTRYDSPAAISKPTTRALLDPKVEAQVYLNASCIKNFDISDKTRGAIELNMILTSGDEYVKEKVTRILKTSDVLPLLVQMIAFDDPDAAAAAASTVAKMSGDAEKMFLINQGVIQNLFKCITLPIIKCRREGCAAIWNLLPIHEARMMIMQEKLYLQMLVSLLDDIDLETLQYAASSIAALVSNPNFMEDVVSSMAVPPLVRILRQNIPSAAQVAASALALLASVDKYRQMIVDERAVQPLVNMLVYTSNPLQARIRAAAAIVALTQNNEIVNSEAALKAIPAFVDLLKCNVVDGRDVAASAIRRFSSTTRFAIEIARNNGIKSLVEALRDVHLNIITNVLHSLQGMIFNIDMVTDIVDQNGLVEVINWIRTGQLSVRFIALNLTNKLIVTSNYALKSACNLHLIDVVIELLKKSDDSKECEVCTSILKQICSANLNYASQAESLGATELMWPMLGNKIDSGRHGPLCEYNALFVIQSIHRARQGRVKMSLYRKGPILSELADSRRKCAEIANSLLSKCF